MIRIKAFRAVNNESACQQFADGHLKVLADYGVTKVTSAKNDWMYNPDVYVIIAYHKDTGEVVGGVRVHVSGTANIPLPFESAVAQVDERVIDLVKKRAEDGTAELCGLWNAKVVAGLGLGIKYLMWAGLGLFKQIGLKTMFALAAAHTLKISLDKGFIIERSLGDNGAFIYPKLDLVATCIVIPDLTTLEYAESFERDRIFELAEKLQIKKQEQTQKGLLEVEYDLDLTS